MGEVSSAIARPRHLRQARICMSGARGWWKHYGFDWQDFLANGISADTLAGTGDHFALRVAALAREDDGR